MKGKVQAVLVPKKWKRASIEKWLARNKFKAELEEEDEHWVAVQEPAESFARIRTVKRARGVVFRIGYAETDPEPAAESRPWWDVPLGDLFNRQV